MAATLNLTFYDATGIDTYYYLNHRKTIDKKFVNGSFNIKSSMTTTDYVFDYMIESTQPASDIKEFTCDYVVWNASNEKLDNGTLQFPVGASVTKGTGYYHLTSKTSLLAGIPNLSTYGTDPNTYEINIHRNLVTSKAKITYNLSNCSSSVTDTEIAPGTNFVCTLTASDGTKFVEAPTVTMANVISKFALSADSKTATISITVSADIVINAVAAAPTQMVSDFVTVFLPTPEQLNAISKTILDQPGVSADGSTMMTKINEMYQVFLDVPAVSSKEVNIKGVKMGVNSDYTTLVTQQVKSDSVVIAEKYNSALDYSPHTKTKLYLPFAGFTNIEPSDCVGKTLALTLDCNIYNVEGVWSVYSDGVLIDAKSCKCGFDYPFRISDTIKYSSQSPSYYTDLVPKLLIEYHKPILDTSARNFSMTDSISNFHGYCEIDTFAVDVATLESFSHMTNEEFESIERTLHNGVIFD